MLTAELIRRGAQRFPERTAVLCGDEALTFAEVDELANRLAHALAQEPGTHVGLLLGNSLLSIPVDFACAKAGLVRVPLNTRLAAAEQEEMLRGTGVSLLVHGADEAERAAELQERIPGLRLRALEDDLVPAAEDASPDDPLVPVEPADPLLALYTSGTTGKLKAVVHTQASYAAICANILANLLDDVRRDDVMLHAASLIHASGTLHAAVLDRAAPRPPSSPASSPPASSPRSPATARRT